MTVTETVFIVLEVLGTIAGDNTLLIIGRSHEAIEALENRFNNLLKR